MKKLLACVLAVAMILTLMPTLVVANNGGDDYIFFDDFSDSGTLGTKWVYTAGGGSQTSIQQDHNRMHVFGDHAQPTAAYEGDILSFDNFIIETEIAIYSGGGPHAGILFRGGTGRDDAYGVRFDLDGHVVINSAGYDSPQGNYLARSATPVAPRVNIMAGDFDWIEVRIEVIGDTVTVYVEDVYAVSYDNLVRASGRISLYSVWTNALFSNFRVSEIPAPLPDLHVDGNPVVSRPIIAGENATVTANAVGIGAEEVVMFVALFDDDTFVRAVVGVNNNGALSASIPLTNLDYEVRYFIWNNVATMVPVPIW